MAFDSLTTLVLSLFRAHQVIVADGDQLASQWRLSSAKWKTLGAIALAGRPITGPEIGRSMGLSRQGAQKQLDALMRERLVSRAVNEADARAPLYTLTSKGLGTYEQVTAKWRARSKQLLRELDVGELLGAAKALDDVVTAIAANPQPPSRRKG
jgi:DNA-binding MarR family transcriptional regulator